MRLEPRRLAVLIDMDQEEPDLLGRVLGKAATYGTVATRRAYGNCKKLADWKECLRHHGIKAVPNYADGGNAADITLIIDAMDLLHCGAADGFCIVTSDCHFTGLVRRLRRQGVFVAGIGRRHAPELLKEALGYLFTAIEDLHWPAEYPDRAYGKAERDMINRIRAAIGEPGDYVLKSTLGKRLTGIDYSAYCHGDLTSLLKSYPEEFIILDGASIKRPSDTYVGLVAALR